MKKIIYLFILLISYSAYSQSLSLFNILPYGFPETKANFYAFDANDNIITNLSPNDFEIIEDGKNVDILSVICGEGVCNGGNYSAVLAMDISGSTSGQKLPAEKTAAEIYIDMLPAGGSELAIIGFNHKNFLVNDFSTDKVQLKKSFETLTSSGGTNFNAALIDPLNGALLIAERAKFGKRIILVTDGLSEGDEQAIIQKANELKAKIFVVIINGKSSEFINAITSMTGGFYFNVNNAAEAASVFRKLSGISGCSGAGCEIVWKSEPTCSDYREVTITVQSLSVNVFFRYMAYSKSKVETTVNPTSFILNRISLGTKDTTVSFTLKNEHYPVQITAIRNTNAAYQVVNYGGTPPPFKLGTGESRIIQVKYKPQVNTTEIGNVVIEKDYCGNHTVSFLSYNKAASDTIIVVSPNGKEKLLSEGDTTITWQGNPQDSVTIEYSLDNGKTWTLITRSARGLKYRWKIPDVESNSCLIRIFRDDNPDGFVDGSWFGYGSIACMDLSPDGKKLVSAGFYGKLFIWDTDTYKVIDTVEPPVQMQYSISDVKWSPDNINIAYYNPDYGIMLYNTITHKLTELIKVANKNFAWNGDGKLIACVKLKNEDVKNDYNYYIGVFDIFSKSLIDSIDIKPKYLLSMAWSKNEKYISYSLYDSTITIYDYQLKTVINELRLDGLVLAMEYNNMSNVLAFQDDMNMLYFYDLVNNTMKNYLLYNSSLALEMASLSWSPNDKKLAIGDDHSGTSGIFDLQNKEFTSFDKLSFDSRSSEFGTVHWSNNANTLYWGYLAHASLVEINLTDKSIVSFIGHNDRSLSIDWNLKNNNILFNDDSYWTVDQKNWFHGATKIYNAKTNDLFFYKIVDQASYFSKYSPDYTKYAILHQDRISIYNSSSNKLENRFSEKGGDVKFSWSPNSKYIAILFKNRIVIWDILTGDSIAGYSLHVNPKNPNSDVKDCNWSSDGKLLSGIKDSTMYFWDTQSGKEIYKFQNDDFIGGFNWSPDNQKIIFSSRSHVKILDYRTKSLITTIKAIMPSEPQWSRDGEMISFIDDHKLRVINSNNYKVIKEILPRAYFSAWTKYVWSENSKWICMAGSRGEIILVRAILPSGDISDTCFSIIKPKLMAETVDMLQQCINSPEPKEITKVDYIFNNETFAVRIDSIKIEGTNSADFGRYPKNYPIILQANTGLTVKFTFQPTTPGLKQAEMVCYSNYGNIRKTITGEALDCNIVNVAPTYSFVNVCLNEKVDTLAAVLYNNGMSSAQIDSTVELGPDFDQFEILNFVNSFSIAPSDTYRIKVEYKPIKEGMTTCRYAFYHKGINSPEIITFLGEGIKCELQAGIAQTIEIIEPCEKADYKEQIFTTIINNSKNDVIIDSLEFSPKNSIFSIKDNLIYPFTMKRNEKKSITIRYTPTDTGKVCGILKIYYNNLDLPKEMDICGNYKKYDWIIQPDTIKSYLVQNGETRSEKFVVKNFGNTKLYWPNPPIKLNNGKFTIISIIPNPTPASGTSEMIISFVGEEITYSGIIGLSNICETSDSLAIYSISDKIKSMVLRSDTLIATPSDIIKVPFYLKESSDYLFNNSTGVYTEISFNLTTLFPMENSDIKVIRNTVDDDGVTKRMTLLLPKRIYHGDKIYLDMLVALGNSDSTIIHFNQDSTRFVGYSEGFDINAINGLIKINVCREGGTRLFNPTGKAEILSIMPNPASEDIEIKVNLIENGLTIVTIYNSNGMKMKEYNINGETGLKTINLDVRDFSNGLYFIQLQTPTVLENQKLMIIK